jgi:hypothetical protein
MDNFSAISNHSVSEWIYEKNGYRSGSARIIYRYLTAAMPTVPGRT